MPFKSKAQQRLFFAKMQKGEIAPEKVKEWVEETKKMSGGFKGLPDKVEHAQKKASLYLLTNNRRTPHQKINTLIKTASHNVECLPIEDWCLLQDMKYTDNIERDNIRTSLLEKNAGVLDKLKAVKDRMAGIGRSIKKEIDPATGQLKKLEVTEGKTQRPWMEQLGLQVAGGITTGVILNKMLNRSPNSVHIHLDANNPEVKKALLAQKLEEHANDYHPVDAAYKVASLDDIIVEKIPAVSKKVVGTLAGLAGFAVKKGYKGIKDFAKSGGKKVSDVVKDHYELKNLKGIY